MLGPLPARATAVSQFHITTQDDLPGPDGDEPYVMFVNQTEYGIGKFLGTNVFSARPDPKSFPFICFRLVLKRHPSDSAGGSCWPCLRRLIWTHPCRCSAATSTWRWRATRWRRPAQSRYRCCHRAGDHPPGGLAEAAKAAGCRAGAPGWPHSPGCSRHQESHRCHHEGPARAIPCLLNNLFLQFFIEGCHHYLNCALSIEHVCMLVATSLTPSHFLHNHLALGMLLPPTLV
jgi:hypothetical protein